MFPKLSNPIYDMDLTEKNKYQKDLMFLDLQGLKIQRPAQPLFNQIIFDKNQQKDDPSILRLMHERYYNSSVPSLPPLHIIRPIKKEGKSKAYIKAQFIKNQFENYEKLFQS